MELEYRHLHNKLKPNLGTKILCTTLAMSYYEFKNNHGLKAVLV